MDKRLLKITLAIYLFLFLIFSPIASLNNIDIYLLDILKYPTLIYVFIILLLFYIGFLIGFILDAIFKKSCGRTVILIFSLLNVIFCFCFPIFNKTIGKVNISNGSITLGISYSIIFLYYLSQVFKDNVFTIKDIVEIALFVCLAIILDLPTFKIKVGSSGGSISFCMVPLGILALRKDFFKSFLGIGIIYSVITCFFDGYGIVTFPLDYLLGFGCISLISLLPRKLFNLNKNKTKFIEYLSLIFTVLIVISIRTFAATMSGIFIYNLKFIPSLIYQLTYIGPSGAILLVFLVVLYKPIKALNKRF